MNTDPFAGLILAFAAADTTLLCNFPVNPTPPADAISP